MARFTGARNVRLGNPGEEWAVSEWDDAERAFVVDVKGAALKKFRPVADDYGFAEAPGEASDG